MNLIVKPAYLYVCECGEHGRIILSDGTECRECCSRQGVLEELTRLQNEGAVSPHEIVHIKESIPSRWPRLTEDASLLALFKCGLNNELTEAFDCLSDEEKQDIANHAGESVH